MLRVWGVVLLALGLATGAIQAQESSAERTGGSGTDYVILYEKPNFQGGRIQVTGDVTNLADYRGFNDQISSIQVFGSSNWVVYEHSNYKGRWTILPPGNYATMNAAAFPDDTMSSIHKEIKKTPPPKPKLPDLQRKVDARAGYNGVVEGEGEARIARDVTFRGLTAYVTVTNAGEADAAASTLVIKPGKAMSDLASYISEGKHHCAVGEVPWPEKAGGPVTCTKVRSSDIVAQPGEGQQTCAIPALAIGQSARCVAVMSVLYNWVVPEIDDWSITAFVDSGKKVKESNEKNNGDGAEIKVTGDDLPPMQ